MRPRTRFWMRLRSGARRAGRGAVAGVGVVGAESAMTSGLGESGRARSSVWGSRRSPPAGSGVVRQRESAGDALLVAARLHRSALRSQARLGVYRRCGWFGAGLGAWGACARRRWLFGAAVGGGVPESEWDTLILQVVRPRSRECWGTIQPPRGSRARFQRPWDSTLLSAVESQPADASIRPATPAPSHSTTRTATP